MTSTPLKSPDSFSILFGQYWKLGQQHRSLQTLSKLYTQASDRITKKFLVDNILDLRIIESSAYVGNILGYEIYPKPERAPLGEEEAKQVEVNGFFVKFQRHGSFSPLELECKGYTRNKIFLKSVKPTLQLSLNLGGLFYLLDHRAERIRRGIFSEKEEQSRKIREKAMLESLFT